MKWRELWLVVISLMVTLFIAEGALRVIGFSYPSFYQYDLHTGSALRPGTEGYWQEEGESYVRINSAGMRDDREIAVEKPADTYRIAVLGDSYAEALQIDVASTFWRQLENKLAARGFASGKKIEVLNFGVSGYSTAQELITLRERVKRYKPDLVLLAFLSGNDVRDNSRETANGVAGSELRPYFTLAANGDLLADESFRKGKMAQVRFSWYWRIFRAMGNHLRTIQLLNKVKNTLGQLPATPKANNNTAEIGLDDHVYLSSPPPPWERAWQVSESLIQKIWEESEGMGAHFLLVTLTNPGQVEQPPERRRAHAKRLGEATLFYPERRLQAFANRNGIDAVFLAGPFAEYSDAHRTYLHGFPNTQMGGGHWNVSGHTLAANLIVRHLCPNRTAP